MREKIEKLLQSDIKGTTIEEKTGISRAVISKLRKNQRSIGGLRLDTCEKLVEFYDEIYLKK
ncbi:hypothetical protein [Macrococcus capreoli]|uniref:hypothetical protein n=1 Tax=Macrococcus capreoli TaxID=2982690 RepID=UPI003EE746B0